MKENKVNLNNSVNAQLERTPLKDIAPHTRQNFDNISKQDLPLLDLNKEFHSPLKICAPKDLGSPDRRSLTKLNFENSPRATSCSQEKLPSPLKRRCTDESSELKENKVILNNSVSVVLERTPLKDIAHHTQQNIENMSNQNTSLFDLNRKFHSPLKICANKDLGSPVRRSPRKLNFENSPSTLISRLNVSSPVRKLSSTVGVLEPDCKYQCSSKLLMLNFLGNSDNRITFIKKLFGIMYIYFNVTFCFDLRFYLFLS